MHRWGREAQADAKPFLGMLAGLAAKHAIGYAAHRWGREAAALPEPFLGALAGMAAKHAIGYAMRRWGRDPSWFSSAKHTAWHFAHNKDVQAVAKFAAHKAVNH